MDEGDKDRKSLKSDTAAPRGAEHPWLVVMPSAMEETQAKGHSWWL